MTNMNIIKRQISFKAIAAITSTAMILFVASCSSNSQYDSVNTEPITNSESLSVDDQIAVSELIDSINHLNIKYPSMVSRGGFWSGGFVGLADMAGSAAGGAIGGWAGGAIGSAGGPGGAIVGHLVGRKVGPFVCCFLASGVAQMICHVQRKTPDYDIIHKKFELIYVISDNDSIGYFHNEMMGKIANNRARYEQSGTLNYNLMYQDITNYLREKGQYDDALDNPLVKFQIINKIKGICEISKKYESEPISEDFIDAQCEYLKTECNMTDSDIKLYKDFTVALYNKCSSLPDAQVENYSKELNQTIKNSKVSESVKERLEKTADLTINSSLCWKKNL